MKLEDSGQAGATIEITPAMIEAGVDALRYGTDSYVSWSDYASSVAAMLSAGKFCASFSDPCEIGLPS
jgi:hypothetical protein